MAWEAQLGGAVIGQPLYVRGVWTGRAVLDMVYAGTAAGDVFGLDAATGAVVWRVSYGYYSSDNCQIYSTYGVGGAPAIDRASNTLYVVAYGAENGGWLHALDLASGLENQFWSPVALFDQSINYNYGALNLYAGRVYVPVGGHSCDQWGYHGAVFSVNVTDGTFSTFHARPPGTSYSQSGIWGPGGVVVAPDDSGTPYVWAATGNGRGAPSTTDVREWDGYGEKVLKIDLNMTLAGMAGPKGLLNGYPDGGFG